MKRFKYKFTTLMKGTIFAGLALSVAGFVINLVLCIKYGTNSAANPVYPILQYSLMFFVTVLLFAILLSVLLNSAYVIDGNKFKTKFGFITSKYDVDTIESVTLDRKTNKLAVTFENGTFIVIVVKQDWYDDFIEALLAANPKIEYSINSLENKPEDEKKDNNEK